VTAEKVNVLGGDYQQVLVKHIDPEYIFEEYGGKAPCEKVFLLVCFS